MLEVCYIGLGGNLGDPLSIFQRVIQGFLDSDSFRLLKCSSFYQTKPLTDDNQPDYLNAVVAVETSLTPHELLDTLLDFEHQFGRVRTGQRWISRTLDLDILLYGDWQINDSRLTIPHPEIPNRDFVLIPLLEIAPDLVIPGMGHIRDLSAACKDRGMSKLSSSCANEN